MTLFVNYRFRIDWWFKDGLIRCDGPSAYSIFKIPGAVFSSQTPEFFVANNKIVAFKAYLEFVRPQNHKKPFEADII